MVILTSGSSEGPGSVLYLSYPRIHCNTYPNHAFQGFHPHPPRRWVSEVGYRRTRCPSFRCGWVLGAGGVMGFPRLEV